MADGKYVGTTYDLHPLSLLRPGRPGKVPRSHPWGRLPDIFRLRCYVCGVRFDLPKDRLSGKFKRTEHAEKHFCSISCSTKFKRSCGIGGRKKTGEWGACANCGERMWVHPYRKRKTACSNRCSALLRSQKESPEESESRLRAMWDGSRKRWRDDPAKTIAGAYRNCTCGEKVTLDVHGRWSKRHRCTVFCSTSCASKWRGQSRSIIDEKIRLARGRENLVKRNGTPFRSLWEAGFAEACDRAGMGWTFEPETFETPHGFYTPDFLVAGQFVDVKGRSGEKQDVKVNHLVSCGTPLSTLRSVRHHGPPDFDSAVDMLKHGLMPPGHVFV